MTPTSPIPVYPPTVPALLLLLLERERARLLGPTVTQALVSDESGDTRRAAASAMEALAAAHRWVEQSNTYFHDISK